MTDELSPRARRLIDAAATPAFDAARRERLRSRVLGAAAGIGAVGAAAGIATATAGVTGAATTASVSGASGAAGVAGAGAGATAAAAGGGAAGAGAAMAGAAKVGVAAGTIAGVSTAVVTKTVAIVAILGAGVFAATYDTAPPPPKPAPFVVQPAPPPSVAPPSAPATGVRTDAPSRASAPVSAAPSLTPQVVPAAPKFALEGSPPKANGAMGAGANPASATLPAPAIDPAFEADVRALDEAHRRHKAGDASGALGALASIRASSPFAEERASLRIIVLCESGRIAEGRAELAAFRATYARSLQTARAADACERR